MDFFTGSTADDTLRWIIGVVRDAVDKNAKELKRKTRAVRTSALIIVTALGLVVSSLIYSQETNHAQVTQTTRTSVKTNH